MTSLDERVDRLEREVQTLRHQVDSSHGSNAAAIDLVHRDVQRLLAGQERTDQRLGGVEQQLVGVEGRLVGMDQRLDGMDSRLGGVEQQLVGMDQRLGGVEQQLGGVNTTLAEIVRRLPEPEAPEEG